MSTHLCIRITWLGDRYHGLTEDKGGPEWPPSPLRLLQALVSCAYQHGVYDLLLPALKWLERQEAPDILADHQPQIANGFDHFVPDNDNRLDHKKPVVRIIKPVLLAERASVTYVWAYEPDDRPPIEEIEHLCSTLSTLGCGIDQAFASATLAAIAAVESNDLGTRRQFRHIATTKSTSIVGTLRTPNKGTLTDLNRVFFQNRKSAMVHTERRKKRWPTAFDRYVYSGMTEQAPHPHTVFKLVAPNGEDPARYPHAKLMHIAAMTRSLAIKSCQAAGYDPEFVSRFVRGKNEPVRDDHKQISYVPLPSIGHEHADVMIRNVMLVAPIGMDQELARVVRAIDGRELVPERDEGEDSCDAESVVPPNYRAELQSFKPPKDRFIAKCYLGSSCVWETVTSMILDEHAKKVDRKNEETSKIEKVWNHDELICLALKRAGVETPCKFIWQSIPFLKNCLSAHRYDREKRPTGYYRPKRLDGKTAVHVRIIFDHPVPGPITLGAGRHCGFGLMAVVE